MPHNKKGKRLRTSQAGVTFTPNLGPGKVGAGAADYATAAQAAGLIPALSPDVAAATGPNMPMVIPTGQSSQGSTSGSEAVTPVLPPIGEILADLRARRAERQLIAQSVVDSILQAAPVAAPEGLETFPGFEPGGLFDILMGTVTGKGASAAANVPQALRQPGKMTVPISSLKQEVPALADEFSGALGMAKQLLAAMALPRTGTSAATSGGTSTSASLWDPNRTSEGQGSLIDTLIQAALLAGGGLGTNPLMTADPAAGASSYTLQDLLGGSGFSQP